MSALADKLHHVRSLKIDQQLRQLVKRAAVNINDSLDFPAGLTVAMSGSKRSVMSALAKGLITVSEAQLALNLLRLPRRSSLDDVVRLYVERWAVTERKQAQIRELLNSVLPGDLNGCIVWVK